MRDPNLSGMLTWVWGSDEEQVGTGRLQYGNRHDLWVMRFADGIVLWESTYVDGILQ